MVGSSHLALARQRLALKPGDWYESVAGLLRLGTAKRVNGKRVIFPFYPLRLAWYREVFRQIEAGWLRR